MVPGSRSAGAVRTSRDHCLATGALLFTLRLPAGRPPLDGPATSAPSRRGSVPRVLPTSSAPLSPVFGPLVHPCGRAVQPVRMSHLGLGDVHFAPVAPKRSEISRDPRFIYREIFPYPIDPHSVPQNANRVIHRGGHVRRFSSPRRARREFGASETAIRFARLAASNRREVLDRRGHRSGRGSPARRGSAGRRTARARSGRGTAPIVRAPTARAR